MQLTASTIVLADVYVIQLIQTSKIHDSTISSLIAINFGLLKSSCSDIFRYLEIKGKITRNSERTAL